MASRTRKTDITNSDEESEHAPITPRTRTVRMRVRASEAKFDSEEGTTPRRTGISLVDRHIPRGIMQRILDLAGTEAQLVLGGTSKAAAAIINSSRIDLSEQRLTPVQLESILQKYPGLTITGLNLVSCQELVLPRVAERLKLLLRLKLDLVYRVEAAEEEEEQKKLDLESLAAACPYLRELSLRCFSDQVEPVAAFKSLVSLELSVCPATTDRINLSLESVSQLKRLQRLVLVHVKKEFTRRRRLHPFSLDLGELKDLLALEEVKVLDFSLRGETPFFPGCIKLRHLELRLDSRRYDLDRFDRSYQLRTLKLELLLPASNNYLGTLAEQKGLRKFSYSAYELLATSPDYFEVLAACKQLEEISLICVGKKRFFRGQTFNPNFSFLTRLTQLNTLRISGVELLALDCSLCKRLSNLELAISTTTQLTLPDSERGALGLRRLELEGIEISSELLTQIGAQTELRELVLRKVKPSVAELDYEVLANLTQLETLSIPFQRDTSYIAAMPNLKKAELRLYHGNFSEFKNCAQLEELSLSRPRITSAKRMPAFPSLKRLLLDGANYREAKIFLELPSLRELSLLQLRGQEDCILPARKQPLHKLAIGFDELPSEDEEKRQVIGLESIIGLRELSLAQLETATLPRPLGASVTRLELHNLPRLKDLSRLAEFYPELVELSLDESNHDEAAELLPLLECTKLTRINLTTRSCDASLFRVLYRIASLKQLVIYHGSSNSVELNAVLREAPPSLEISIHDPVYT